ncbi:MAG: spore coat protein [Clostridiales bacterium]|jgi:spore coat protein CotF|nr:spore coat protein [Clostridiales bacterium]
MDQIPMQEKEVFNDVLSSQKFITDTYNTFANECVTPNVRSEFMRILNEEHQIQSEVFDEMQKRGWYQTPAAEQQKIQQAKQKYQNMNQPQA